MPEKSLCSGSRAAFGAVCPDRHYLYPVSDLSFRRTSDHCIDRSGRFPCRRDCRFASVAAGSFLSFRKSPCTRKDSRQDLSADKGPFHTVFSHFPEQDPSDTSRQHRSGPDPTDASAFRHDSLRLTEDLWDLYRNGTAPAPVSFHHYNFRSCNADALCRKNGCPWRSETDPLCHRPDFFSLHVSGIFVWKRILSLWTIPWNTAFSQQNCRNLHTVSFFHLSFFSENSCFQTISMIYIIPKRVITIELFIYK